MTIAQLSFAIRSPLAADLTDAEFLQSLGWRKGADGPLRAWAEAGDPQRFAERLRRLLRSGQRSRRVKAITPFLLHPLWSRRAFDESLLTDREAARLTKLHRRLAERRSGTSRADSSQTVATKSDVSKIVERSLRDVIERPPAPSFLLVWLTVLSEAGPSLTAETLFTLWRATLETSLALTNRDESADTHGRPDDQRLLLFGELPWRVGLSFRELQGAGKLTKAGRSVLRDGLEALTDGDGTPHARALERLPLTLAVLTRSVYAGDLAGESLWDAGSAERFELLVDRAAALCQADGRIALSNGASFAPASLLRAASQVCGLSRRAASVQRLLSLPDDLPTGRKPRPQAVHRKRPMRFDSDESPASQSDWAELACLRNNWLPGADGCVITHHLAQPQICLTAFERVLLNGDWLSDLRVDGAAVDRDHDWSCVCWHSDEDADYLELQQDADGVTVFRQAMLSRTDHWLFLAEGVTAPAAETIDLTTRLPLVESVSADPARWTRELVLRQKKLVADVYPLGLDQQRIAHAHGSLEADGGEMKLTHRIKGTAAYAPLVIDWSPDRRRSPAQWRPLTVAEDGVILRHDQAAGYRLRVGKHQWLFYRSLTAGEASRTVLGYHTPHETVIAEFTTDGDVVPLVLVE